MEPLCQDENSNSCQIHILHAINEWWPLNSDKHERVKYEEGRRRPNLSLLQKASIKQRFALPWVFPIDFLCRVASF